MDIQKLLDNLIEEVSCSFCKNIYKDPKLLPECLHSFCLACLDEMTRTGAVNSNIIQCPLCQMQVPVPESGTFESLTSSFYIDRLLDVFTIKQCSTSHVTCGNCAKKYREDNSYCFNCSRFWCGHCLNAHNILQENKEHRVVALKDFQAKDYEDVIKRPVICKKKHHQKVLKYYCKECDVAACQVCAILDHGGHNIQHLEDIAEEKKAGIVAQVEKAKNKSQQCAENIQNNKREFMDVQQQVEAIKEEVNNFAVKMVQVIRERKEQLIVQAEKARKRAQDELEIRNGQLQTQFKEILSAINQAENLVLRGASAEIVIREKQVEKRLQQLVTEEPEMRPTENGKLAFAENPGFVSSLTSDGIGLLGKSYANRVESTAEGEGLTEAVTGLEAQFVVTTRDSKGDVCYSPVDRVCAEIKRRGEENAVTNVQIQNNKDGTYRVSYFATDPGDHDVRVTVNREDVRGSPFLPVQVKPREFKSEKSFGTEGTKPGEFKNPWGVAVSEQGDMAVSDHSNHRVQVFSSEGKFLLSFGDYGSGQGQFVGPRGVTYDRDGNLLVADKGNNRIQQFTRTGQFIRNIGRTGELDSKLSLLQGISSCPNGNIVVTDSGNKRVVVFSPEGLTLTLKDDELHPFHCIYHDNRFIVSNGDGHCVKVYSENGVFLYQFGTRGAGNGQFNFSRGLGIAKSGELVVCDKNNNRIQLFKLHHGQSTFCCKFGLQDTSLGNLRQPMSVAVLKDGKFAVTDWKNHRVEIIQ